MQHTDASTKKKFTIWSLMPCRDDTSVELRIEFDVVAMRASYACSVHHRCRRAQIVSILSDSERKHDVCLLPEYAMQKQQLDQCQQNTQKPHKHLNTFKFERFSLLHNLLMPLLDYWVLFFLFEFQMTWIWFEHSLLRALALVWCAHSVDSSQ